jgi:hypothetical protein
MADTAVDGNMRNPVAIRKAAAPIIAMRMIKRSFGAVAVVFSVTRESLCGIWLLITAACRTSHEKLRLSLARDILG